MGRWKNPEKRKEKRIRVNMFYAHFRTYGEKKLLRDRDYILHVGRYPGHNQVCNFWSRSVMGFGRGKGSNFPFPLTCVVAIQNSRTTVRVCDYRTNVIDVA